MSENEMPNGEMRVDLGGGREQIRRVNYPSNSKLSREKNKAEQPEKKPVEKIVTGTVERRKRGMGSKLLKTFVVEDSESILQYVLMDVLIPAAKTTISDAITQAIQHAFYGGAKAGVGPRAGYTSYNRVSTQGRAETIASRSLSRQARATHDFSDLVLKTRSDAQDVLDNMRTVVDNYSMVSVNDFYEMLGLTADFADAKWGWTNLRDARIRPVQGGYVFDFPETEPLT